MVIFGGNVKVLLHIGQSKTGTSAIQAFLTLNRKTLQEAGVLYPVARVSGMPVEMGAHNAVADALVGLSRFPYIDAEEYFAQFFAEAAQLKAELLILSAEHFFGGEPRIWDTNDSDEYFELYEQKIKRLAEFLQGHEVSIIVYLRPQLDWLASAVGQTVRIQRLISDRVLYEDDKQFFELMKPLLMYSKLLDIWSETLKPVNFAVIPYIRETLYKKSSISDFLFRAGLEHIRFPYASHDVQVNKSLTREYLEVKKLLNRTPRSKTSERVVIHILEKLSETSDMSSDYSLDPAVRQKLELLCEQDNERLNDRYRVEGIAFSSRGKSDRDESTVEETRIAAAMLRFEKEYHSLHGWLLWTHFAIKNFLRNHCRPLHALLHQFKMAGIKHKYKN